MDVYNRHVKFMRGEGQAKLEPHSKEAGVAEEEIAS